MLQPDEAAEIALDGLLRAGADGASVSASHGKMDELTVESGEFVLMRSVFSSALVMKAIRNRKAGTVAVNTLERDAIAGAVTECMDAALAAEPDDAEAIAPKEKDAVFAEGVPEGDREALFASLDDFLKTAKTRYPAIRLEQVLGRYGKTERVFLNSNGTRFREEEGHYSFSTMFSPHDGERAGSFSSYGVRTDELRRPLIGRGMLERLMDGAVRELDAEPVTEKFTGTLILSPAVLGEFLDAVVDCYAGNSALIGGTSIWREKLGKQVASPDLTVATRPLDPRIVGGERYTPEGYLSEDMTILEKGVLRRFVLGDYAARKTRQRRAGNLSGAYILEPGRESLRDLLRSVGNGILINRFSGGEPAVNGDFTGIAKNSFLIRNGEPARAVTETMISGNLSELLNRVRGISAETVSDGSTVLPWLALDGITVS